jgi:hypothetical protein
MITNSRPNVRYPSGIGAVATKFRRVRVPFGFQLKLGDYGICCAAWQHANGLPVLDLPAYTLPRRIDKTYAT